MPAKIIIKAMNFALFMDSKLDKVQFHDLLAEKQFKKDAISTLVINGKDSDITPILPAPCTAYYKVGCNSHLRQVTHHVYPFL